MIDWAETQARLGFTENNITVRKNVVSRCDECGVLREVTFKQAKRTQEKTGTTLCTPCASKKSRRIHKKSYELSDKRRSESLSITFKKKWQNEGYRSSQLRAINQNKEKISKTSERLWKDENYRNKVTTIIKSNYDDPEYRQMMRKIYDSEEYRTELRDRWKDGEYRQKVMAMWEDEKFVDDFIKKCSIFSKSLWERPEYREKMRKLWENKEHREKMTGLQLINYTDKRLSPLQHKLYQILSGLGINYYKEGPKTKIGYYILDCIIPKQGKMKKNVAIECHGERIHSQPKKRKKDKGKEAYLQEYFSDKYDLKIIWGQWFLFRNKVESMVKEWVGIDDIRYKQVDFNFCETKIREDIKYRDATKFLSEFHYLYTCPRGSRYFGVFLDNKMIAICLISSLIRQNIAASIGDFKHSEVLELSRFCIHPNYQKKNFASWFISKCIKRIDCKAIIAYADGTIGHEGTIYKASGFKLDKIVRPDYWYIDQQGFVMHKRTLYGHASRMSTKESDYAKQHNYSKVFGGNKFRFVKFV